MSDPMLIFESLYAEIARLKEENTMMTEQAFRFRDLCIEKDAEIGRLRADLNEASDWNISYRKLITELADLIEQGFGPSGALATYKFRLQRAVQRAREATR